MTNLLIWIGGAVVVFGWGLMILSHAFIYIEKSPRFKRFLLEVAHDVVTRG